MWLWFILGGLLIGIAWALKFTLQLPTLIPIVSTVGVIILVGLIWLLKYWFALRAAKKLQEVIENQGEQQAMNARPERRAEIQELRKQLLGGLSALKSSKLGRGGKRGGTALYTMPWYMIIGPPGAGKTTALTHSGLVFPYGSSTGPGGGGGVRGVGGTRNCDWWFTNEAILLDTAGRYTTEQDDREEWITFLNFLKKYRPKRPINGVIIAISISELIDANEMQIEAIGKKLRARIDEVTAQLHMVLPVYILFTKIDLIAGFNEFFGDMRKSDRAKSWGATIKLELPKNEPGRIFGAEFDILVKQLHARGLKRMVMERGREVRERLYQFPIEFAGLKKNLSDLIATTFQPNTIQGTPIFRGFYFTSGTQEGRPMDRVLERMSAAMGIRPQASQQQQQQPVVESKSYFLHDVFMTVIFPDGDIAVRSAVEERRAAIMKVLIAGATLVLAGILAVPGATSYSNNKSFLSKTEKSAKKAAAINWTDDSDAATRVKALNSTLEQLKEQDKFDREGVPLTMGWGMYVADQIRRPTLGVYAAQMQAGMVTQCRRALEEQLAKSSGKVFLDDWLALRMYLMLAKLDGKLDHLDVEWATGRFTQLWASILKKSGSASSEGELKLLARPHVEYYFRMVKEGRVTPVEIDPDTVSKTRGRLKSEELNNRYYNLLVNWLFDERIDDANDGVKSNLVFPPIELPDAFPQRTTEILKYILSKSYLLDKTHYTQVLGPYTRKGYAAVLKQFESAEGLMKGESWVFPMDTNLESSDKIPALVAGVRKRYEEEFIRQWLAYFDDIKMKVPTSPAEAREIYRELSNTPPPLKDLLNQLEKNTQWGEEDPLANPEEAENNRKFLARIARYRKLVEPTPELIELGKKSDTIPAKFRSTVNFGRKPDAGNVESSAYTYTQVQVAEARNAVIGEINKKTENFPLADVRPAIDTARSQAEVLLGKDCDDTCKLILRHILLDPLQVGDRPTLTPVTPTSVGTPPPKDKVGPLWNKKPKCIPLPGGQPCPTN